MKKLFLLLLLTSCVHVKKSEVSFNVGDKVRVKNPENVLNKLGLVGEVLDVDDKFDCYPAASYTVQFSVNITEGVLKIPTILCPEEIILESVYIHEVLN